MRFAPHPVKLRIANVFDSVCRFRFKCPATKPACSHEKSPEILMDARKLCRFDELKLRQVARLTETGRSRISRANCPR
jgi:hypothetical protein